MTIRPPTLIIVSILILLSGYTSASSNNENIRIATASNFKPTLRILIEQFQKNGACQTAHGENITVGSKTKFSISAASTGKLYAQIRQGAPYDVFFSADVARPESLLNSGHAISNSLRVYAIGQLLLWVPPPSNRHWRETDNDSTPKASTELSEQQARDLLQYFLAKPNSKIAVANEKTAPYGRAAKEVLRALKFDHGLKTQFVTGENIAQTFHYTQKGGANAGFIALSQSYEHPLQGAYWLVPNHLHTPIQQAVVLLTRAQNKPVTRCFLEYLKSESSIKILAKHGYLSAQ